MQRQTPSLFEAKVQTYTVCRPGMRVKEWEWKQRRRCQPAGKELVHY